MVDVSLLSCIHSHWFTWLLHVVSFAILGGLGFNMCVCLHSLWLCTRSSFAIHLGIGFLPICAVILFDCAFWMSFVIHFDIGAFKDVNMLNCAIIHIDGALRFPCPYSLAWKSWQLALSFALLVLIVVTFHSSFYDYVIITLSIFIICVCTFTVYN